MRLLVSELVDARGVLRRDGLMIEVVVNPDDRPQGIVTVFFDRRIMRRSQ